MIPKIIHYCWFGHNDMMPIMKKCIKSWKKYCPDYEIIEWNEDNFDIGTAPAYVKQAYEAKKWAFVADFVRLKALKDYGGVYMDTDQELIKPLDPFMSSKMFLGFMSSGLLSCGILGAEKNNPIIIDFYNYYLNHEFDNEGVLDITPNTDVITKMLCDKGLKLNDEHQNIDGVEVYPRTYFCPTSCLDKNDCKSKETVSIHHWAMSWRSDKAKKDFARNKRHSTKWYKAYEWVKYLPNKIVRKIVGDKAIDKLKSKIKH